MGGVIGTSHRKDALRCGLFFLELGSWWRPRSHINMLVVVHVTVFRSCLEYAKSGDDAKARRLSTEDFVTACRLSTYRRYGNIPVVRSSRPSWGADLIRYTARPSFRQDQPDSPDPFSIGFRHAARLHSTSTNDPDLEQKVMIEAIRRFPVRDQLPRKSLPRPGVIKCSDGGNSGTRQDAKHFLESLKKENEV